MLKKTDWNNQYFLKKTERLQEQKKATYSVISGGGLTLHSQQIDSGLYVKQRVL
jgi:hypothetical protein